AESDRSVAGVRREAGRAMKCRQRMRQRCFSGATLLFRFLCGLVRESFANPSRSICFVCFPLRASPGKHAQIALCCAPVPRRFPADNADGGSRRAAKLERSPFDEPPRDDPGVREVLHDYFVAHGYAVVGAESADAAKAEAARQAIDLALVDIHMPG